MFGFLKAPKADWGGRAFDVHPASGKPLLPLGGGIYILAKEELVGLADHLAGQTRYSALYIGETGDFADRLRPSRHEEWQRAVDFGMTHVHVLSMLGATKAERLAVERELRERYRPTLNLPPLRVPTLGNPAGLCW